MTERDLRLCAFKLDPDALGSVWVYPWTELLWSRWAAALEAFKAQQKKLHDPSLRLPYASLALSLTAISGGFVRVSPRRWNDVFLVSTQPIPQTTLQMALLVWERQITGTDSDIFRGIVTGPEQRKELAWYFEGGQAPGWVWEVARWRAAQALASLPFCVPGVAEPIPLRLDTEADLLTWSSEGLLRGGKDLNAAAMHRIILEVKLIPGCPGVYLLARAGLSRISAYNTRTARVDLGPELPLLRVGVRPIKVDKGESAERWELRYEDWADKVLASAASRQLPTLSAEALKGTGVLRGIHRGGKYPMGTGVGPYFYEFLAQHIRRALPALEPYTARYHGSMPKTLPPPVPGDDEGRRRVRCELGNTPRLVVLYENKRTRRHLEDALVDILGGEAQEMEALTEGEAAMTACGLEIAFELLAGVGLTTSSTSEGLEDAASAAQGPHLATNRRVITLVETLSSEEIEVARTARRKATLRRDDRSEDQDPKLRLRRHLPSLEVISQFISPFTEERDELHQGARRHYPACGKRMRASREIMKRYGKSHATLKRARNAVWDLLCSAGISLRPHVGDTYVPAGTWLVGVHSVRIPTYHRESGGGSDGWILILSAIQVSGWRSLGWNGRQWVPHHEAVAHHHHQFPQWNKDSLPQEMEIALKALPGVAETTRALEKRPRLIVFISAAPTRLWWPGVADSAGKPLPPILEELDVALIRVRNKGDEVPAVVGRGDGTASGVPRNSNPFDGLFWPFEVANPQRAYWISSTHPRSSNNTIRNHTRYQVRGTSHISKAWHTSGVREILVLRSGPFDARSLILLTVQQLRCHPAYRELSLLRPFPQHLASKVLKDHPRFNFEDEEEVSSDE